MLSDKDLEEIRQKMLDFNAAPPANGWKKISRDIDPSRWRLRLFWWLTSALLITSIGVFVYVDKKDFKADVAEVTPLTSTEPSVNQNINTHQSTSAVDKVTKGKHSSIGNKEQENEKKVIKTSDQNIPNEDPDNSDNVSNLTDNTEPTDASPPQEKAHSSDEMLAGDDFPPNLSVNRHYASGSEAYSIPASLLPKQALELKVKLDTLGEIETDAIVFNINATETKDVVKPQNKNEWALGAFFTPRYNYQSFVPQNTDEVFITDYQKRNTRSNRRIGYEFGATYSRALSSTLHMESSIGITMLNNDVAYSYTSGKVDTIIQRKTDEGTIIATPVFATQEREVATKNMYATFRLGGTWYPWQSNYKRINITLAGGADYLISKSFSQSLNGQQGDPSINSPLLRNLNFNFIAGIGYNVMLFNQMELRVMPVINYQFSSIYKHSEAFGVRPYSIGVNFQLRRVF